MIVFHSVTVPSPSTKVIGSTNQTDGQTSVCSLPPQLSIRRRRRAASQKWQIFAEAKREVEGKEREGEAS